MNLTTDFHLIARLRMRGAVPTSTPYAPLQHVTHTYRFVGALVSNAVFVQTLLSTRFYSYGFVSVIFLSKSIF